MKIIDVSITINASANNVWRVFTEPAITNKMGGEYVSDWKPGSSFGFRGLNGKMYTNGKIIAIVPGSLLKHSLFDPGNPAVVISVITYRIQNNSENTTLSATEELTQSLSEDEYGDAITGWHSALYAVKNIAEKLE